MVTGDVVDQSQNETQDLSRHAIWIITGAYAWRTPASRTEYRCMQAIASSCIARLSSGACLWQDRDIICCIVFVCCPVCRLSNQCSSGLAERLMLQSYFSSSYLQLLLLQFFLPAITILLVRTTVADPPHFFFRLV